MKLGCCVNMLGDSKEPIGRKYFTNLKSAGYDYVELPLAQIMDLSENEFDDLLIELKMAGLTCLCCNNFFPASIRLTGESVDMMVVEKYIASAVKRAVRLGAKRIVFGSSGAKNVPEGFSHDCAFNQIIEVLRLADRYVRSENITIVIEPLNRKESNIILNLSDGERLVREVNVPSVRLLVDYYHFMMEKEKLETLQKVMPDIQHVHFAEPQGRCFPQKETVEYEAFFTVLKEGGYVGSVSVEAYSDCPEKEITKAVILKQYF